MSKIKELYPENSVQITDFEGYVDDLRDKNLETVVGELIHNSIGGCKIKILSRDLFTSVCSK
ncbi:MAG: hypothetical protein ACRCTS_03585 [Fusobacteriaceae bacterium]